MKNTLFRFFLIPLLISILTLSIIYAGALHYLDRQAQDSLYQGQGHASNDIIIIGIDNQTLAELGTYGPGYRTYIAYALEKLSSDPDHPATGTAAAAPTRFQRIHISDQIFPNK